MAKEISACFTLNAEAGKTYTFHKYFAVYYGQ